jgi:hypothetical protein
MPWRKSVIVIRARFASKSSSVRPGLATLRTGTPSAIPRRRLSATVGILAVITSSGEAVTVIGGGTDPTKVPAPLRTTTKPSSLSTLRAERAVAWEIRYLTVSVFSPGMISPVRRRPDVISWRSSWASWR